VSGIDRIVEDFGAAGTLAEKLLGAVPMRLDLSEAIAMIKSGTLDAQVTYTLTDDGRLIFDYLATTDRATPVKMAPIPALAIASTMSSVNSYISGSMSISSFGSFTSSK